MIENLNESSQLKTLLQLKKGNYLEAKRKLKLEIYFSYQIHSQKYCNRKFTKLRCMYNVMTGCDIILGMQTVFKNGNSLAVTVPKPYANELDIEAGTNVAWKKTNEGLLLTTTQSKKPTEIDPEVAKLIKKISKKYAQVWEDLSKV